LNLHVYMETNCSCLLLTISRGYTSVGRQFPKNCDGLSLLVLYESHKSKERLMLIYNLFGEILTSLIESGDIDDAPIDVKL